MLLRFNFFIPFLIFSNFLIAQNVVIQGKVFNKNNDQKISGVTIKVGTIITISDNDGNFKLTTRLDIVTENGIKFSCIGYQSIRLIYQPNHFYEVGLTESNAQLKEVVIGAGDDIIKRAIKQIPQNYPNNPIMLDGLIRTQFSRNKSHYFKSDAIVKAYVPPYNSNDKTTITVLNNHIDSIYDKTIRYLRIIDHYNVVDFQDIAHNKFLLNRISKKRKFDYLLTAKQWYNGHKVFVINTSLKDTGKVFDKLDATFYIDTASYAFVAANVTFNNWVSPGYVKVKRENYTVDYEKIGLKWYLASTHCDVAYEYQNENPTSKIDFIRTQIDSTNIQPFLYKDIVQKTDNVYLIDKPAKKEELGVIDSLFKKAENEGKIEPVSTLLIDTIKKNNVITNPPNQKVKRKFFVSLFDYLNKDNIRSFPEITRLPITINSTNYNVSGSVNYGWTISSTGYRLYKNLFLEYHINYNFWNNKHIDASEFTLNLANNFSFNKKVREAILTPYFGYERLVVSYKKNEVDYNSFNLGLRASLELTHRKALFISSSYNLADGMRTLNGLNISPNHYGVAFGIIFKR